MSERCEAPAMAAHRIIRATNNSHILPRCKSEGTLIELSEGVTGASLCDVKGGFGRLHVHPVESEICCVSSDLSDLLSLEMNR